MGKRMAVVDLYRLENGQLAEHWDSGQLQPEYADTLITMTNGTAVIEDTADPVENKRRINDFYRKVLIPSQLTDADQWLTPGFIEHDIAGGLLNNNAGRIKVHKIIGEGNFIVTHCECSGQDKTFSQFNIFKMEDEKIAEHWSVEQKVPEAMAHGNGMF
jgi:predicted SnoaL-like aldol condensation-catalyzing enzyme